VDLKDARDSKALVERQLEGAYEEKGALQVNHDALQVSHDTLQVNHDTLRSTLGDLEAAKADLEAKLVENAEALSSAQQEKVTMQTRLDSDTKRGDDLESELSTLRWRLDGVKAEKKEISSELEDVKYNLAAERQSKAKIEQQLESASQDHINLQTELSSTQARAAGFESEKAKLASELAEAIRDIEDLRASNAELTSKVELTSQRAVDFEADLRASGLRLDIAQSEGHESSARALEADRELDSLRSTNARLEASEKDLMSRLTSAEEELDSVRDSNARLEAFLERVEADMATTEAALEESEKRLEKFVDESEAKLEAERGSKMKYKHRLLEREHEVEHLTHENEELQHQVGHQTEELGNLRKGKETLATELRNIQEQRQSHELASKTSTSELRHELQSKDATIDELRKTKHDFVKDFAALEQEMQSLREDKRAFERLVASLQDKIEHLQVLDEWAEPLEPSEPASPSKHCGHIEWKDRMPSDLLTPHLTVSTPGSLRSQPSSIAAHSYQQPRPASRDSTHSRPGDLEAWAREVERIRLQRDETAIKIKGMRKQRSDLKKSLRDSEAALHELERHAKGRRPRTLLRKKSRLSTPALRSSSNEHGSPIASSPHTPKRPATSHGTPHTPFSFSSVRSRHSIFSSPRIDRPSTASPGDDKDKPRWSTFGSLGSSSGSNSNGRPGTGRSVTGHSLSTRTFRTRPVTGLEEEEDEGEWSDQGPVKAKRRWSSGLRKLFGKV